MIKISGRIVVSTLVLGTLLLMGCSKSTDMSESASATENVEAAVAEADEVTQPEEVDEKQEADVKVSMDEEQVADAKVGADEAEGAECTDEIQDTVSDDRLYAEGEYLDYFEYAERGRTIKKDGIDWIIPAEDGSAWGKLMKADWDNDGIMEYYFPPIPVAGIGAFYFDMDGDKLIAMVDYTSLMGFSEPVNKDGYCWIYNFHIGMYTDYEYSRYDGDHDIVNGYALRVDEVGPGDVSYEDWEPVYYKADLGQNEEEVIITKSEFEELCGGEEAGIDLEESDCNDKLYMAISEFFEKKRPVFII